jgi:ParB-like chromosome segregation protein Spo0J
MKTYDFHPLANLFPLMEGEDFDALVADIKANELRESIVLFEGMILDGRNRYRAAQAAGLKLEYFDFTTTPSLERMKKAGKAERDAAAIAFVISKNIHRRHLTAEDKRKIVARLLKTNPERSNTAIAKIAKVDDKTVGAVRTDLERRSEIPNVKIRTDSKGRKQPARHTVEQPTGSRRQLTSKEIKEQWETRSPDDFEVGGELKDLIAQKAAGWTGAIVGTQAEVNAAEKRLRDDGADGHWLVLALREDLVVVDHRVIQWLLFTQPAPPMIVHVDWTFRLIAAANKARCPMWFSERLIGKSRPQCAGMTWPRELPQETPNAASAELPLLLEFAWFVIDRAKVTVGPSDDAEFKVLLGKVKAMLGAAP